MTLSAIVTTTLTQLSFKMRSTISMFLNLFLSGIYVLPLLYPASVTDCSALARGGQ